MLFEKPKINEEVVRNFIKETSEIEISNHEKYRTKRENSISRNRRYENHLESSSPSHKRQ
jgi:hypothetical protein